MSESLASLSWAITSMARRQGVVIDPVRLDGAIAAALRGGEAVELHHLSAALNIVKPEHLQQPDRASLPLLCKAQGQGWGILVDQRPDGRWVFVSAGGQALVSNDEVSGGAYLQQDHRLFVGSLRENLLIGLPDPGDEVLRRVMERTGLLRLVAAHPKGLDLPIHEGGRGLSGGQRQLVAFTRLLLCQPDIFLLDEPTASMDEDLERNCLRVLQEEVGAGRTLVVVTHKPAFLPMVDRVIVVVGNRIVLDGPRDAVLARLRGEPSAAALTTVA